jgi:hypothetical protein
MMKETNTSHSIQRLAGEVGKSAETLKTWGLGEGDDLGVNNNSLLAPKPY